MTMAEPAKHAPSAPKELSPLLIALVRTESLAQKALVASVGLVLRHYAKQRAEGTDALVSAAVDIESQVRVTLDHVHAAGRSRGFESALSDFQRILPMLQTGALVKMLQPTDSALMDHNAAAAIANSYAQGWLRSALRLLSSGESPFATVLKNTTEARQWHLKTIATTETSRSFSDERRKAFTSGVYTQAGREGAAHIGKKWDASLDARTCDDCSAMHGQVVRLDQSFSRGEPGSMHPNCRCVEVYIYLH